MSEALEVRYTVPSGGEVEAYAIQPREEPIEGGVLFLHWFDPQAEDGNRTQFLPDARLLAGRGLISLLPQQAFPWSADPTDATSDAARIEAEVARLAAGLDWLAAQGVPRLAIVGHDFGAMYAALLAARDSRVGAGVLIAPANRWADWFLRFWPIADDRIEYMRTLRPLDPIEQIASIAPRPLLLQFAERDFFIAGMDANELYNTAADPKRIERYETDHAMRDERARQDRRQFLLDYFEL